MSAFADASKIKKNKTAIGGIGMILSDEKIGIRWIFIVIVMLGIILTLFG